MSLVEVARAFELADDPAIYRPIRRGEADRIATDVLATGLAYGSHIMSSTDAADRWRQFLALFQGQDVSFFTNTVADAQSRNPATDATFDMGILVIGATRAGCLWVEEED
jgi:hypothetical protein